MSQLCVAPPDILVILKFTATNTDLLAASELDTPPGNGVILLAAASTVNTATIEVPQYNHQPGVVQTLPLWANGVGQLSDLPDFKIPVIGNKRPTIVLGGTTGTIYVFAGYYKQR